jgi:hypothetical protein
VAQKDLVQQGNKMQTHTIDIEATKVGVFSMEKYIVAYAKVTMDKKEGITLQGVYFGGAGETPEQAEAIARECVDTTRGGTILPKIVQVDRQERLIDAMYEAADAFEKLTTQMVEADNIIKRTQDRKKR